MTKDKLKELTSSLENVHRSTAEMRSTVEQETLREGVDDVVVQIEQNLQRLYSLIYLQALKEVDPFLERAEDLKKDKLEANERTYVRPNFSISDGGTLILSWMRLSRLARPAKPGDDYDNSKRRFGRFYRIESPDQGTQTVYVSLKRLKMNKSKMRYSIDAIKSEPAWAKAAFTHIEDVLVQLRKQQNQLAKIKRALRYYGEFAKQIEELKKSSKY